MTNNSHFTTPLLFARKPNTIKNSQRFRYYETEDMTQPRNGD